MKIQGNTILVTGGNSGIGHALAVALHEAGNHVIIAGRRADALKDIVAAHPGMASYVLDVADPAAITAFATTVVREHPNLNVLINNAGIMKPEMLNNEPVDVSAAEETIAVNLLGPIRLTAALLPQLRKQAASTIINVTSGLAFVPLAITPTYSATKAALHSYTQSLRFQLRETSVRVLELAPPQVATELMAGQSMNPNSMPLADFVSESMALLAAGNDEILVERVKLLRNAEATGTHDKIFNFINNPH